MFDQTTTATRARAIAVLIMFQQEPRVARQTLEWFTLTSSTGGLQYKSSWDMKYWKAIISSASYVHNIAKQSS